MKKAVVVLAFVLALAVFSGCMNCYVRFPTTNPEIESCYGCTRTMAEFTVVGSFPQMMSDNPGDGGFMWENLVTIPFIGLPCLVDTACETCIDTVCLPADYFIVRAREKKD